MAAIPIIFSGVFYPKNKKDPPMPGTFFGNAAIAGLGVGGGPVIPVDPPPDITPQPPLVIWGGPFDPPVIWGGPIDPYPDIGLPEPPPDPPPTTVQPPHEGWNWSVAKSGWYYLYVPGSGDPQPKRR